MIRMKRLFGQSISPFACCRDGRRMSPFAFNKIGYGMATADYPAKPDLRLHIEGRRRGSILLITLWTLCLLTVFAIHLGYSVRQKIILIERLNSRDNLYFIADAGIKQASAELKKKVSPVEYDALNEAWSNNPDVFKDVDIGLGSFNIGYNYWDSHSGRQRIRYGLVDEEKKLNLNTSELNDIQRLIIIVTKLDETDAQDLAAAIVDWRDADSKPSAPLGGAEDRYYRNLPNPYEAKDAEFEVFDELFLVKGINKEVFDQLKDYITIYSNGEININTASEQVLLALNLEDDLVNRILSFRCGRDGVEATEDDNVFITPSCIIAELNEFSSLSSSEIVSLNNLISAGKISTSSGNFMVRAVARLGTRQKQIICIINRKGKILSWREG